jgi:hypothetical protein
MSLSPRGLLVQCDVISKFNVPHWYRDYPLCTTKEVNTLTTFSIVSVTVIYPQLYEHRIDLTTYIQLHSSQWSLNTIIRRSTLFYLFCICHKISMQKFLSCGSSCDTVADCGSVGMSDEYKKSVSKIDDSVHSASRFLAPRDLNSVVMPDPATTQLLLCPICSRAFKSCKNQNSNLRRHLKNIHNLSPKMHPRKCK